MIQNEARFNQLIAAALAQPFAGWDFSYIRERWREDPTTWDYTAIVKQHLADATSILDMGTGGGEFLASLAPHLPEDTHATEAYPPNIPIAEATLAPHGITVHTVHGIEEHQQLPFPDERFDLVINRHEWFSAADVYRILKSKGIFITQQVGGKNDIRLNEMISGELPDFTDFDLAKNQQELVSSGFEMRRTEETFPALRFFDIGAIVYYLKVVEWQIPDFEVNRYREQLGKIHNMIETEGEFVVKQHRFLMVGSKA